MIDNSQEVKNLLSVVIVNYNSSIYTNKLINSLNQIRKLINEIIIIDNNSNDLDKLKINNLTKLYKNKVNVGFSKAVNKGILISKSENILLLNPDTFLIDNSIKKMFNFFVNNPKIGAIGGKMYSGNKKYLTANSKPSFMTGLFEFTNLKKIFPNNLYTNKFWVEKNKLIKTPVRVYSLCGGFILFKKNINNKIQLFDEKFFLYLEDLDFCVNINSQNKEVWFYPNTKIQHIGGTSNDSKYKIVLKHWYKSRKYFFKKHEPIFGSILEIIYSIEESLLRLYHFLKNEPNE